MELSIESSCQHVTWKVRDFFQLPSDIDYFVDSPEIRFAGDTYCLRLNPNIVRRGWDGTRIKLQLLRLTSTFPERQVSCKIGGRIRNKRGNEIDLYDTISRWINITPFSREKDRHMYIIDGTFTALCSMRLKEQSTAGSQQSEEDKTSDTKEEQKGLLGQSVFFLTRSGPFTMELSILPQCQNVLWKIPDVFQLLSKTCYSLISPEFRFAGDRYCLRFYPQGNRNADLQLVRLTSTYPERIVLYKIGHRIRNREFDLDSYNYSGTLIDGFVFCFSLSVLEEKKEAFVPDGTLTVVCILRLNGQSSAESLQSEDAGNSHAEEKTEGLPEIPDSVCCAVPAEVSDSVIDKESFKNEDWSSLDMKEFTILSDRMKELLVKGSDHDVTICVQNKKFRAHRNILSARSPVFAMMLTHDTKENQTSTINIEDCNPDSFDDFLLYVYSGRIRNLTPSKALQLYYTADKYDFPVLKERCVSFLETSLSVTSICDVVLLAAKHQEKELLKVASEFFAQNIEEILVTVGWQSFMSENPVEANELYINSVKFFRQKK